MRTITFLLFFALGIQSSYCQAYNIKLNIKNLKDSTIQLAYYFGNNQYIAATTKLDAKGKAEFKGEKALHQGLYIVILPNKYFDIIINENQKFTMEFDAKQPVQSIKFKNSNENQKFMEYQNNVGKMIQEQMLWQKIIDDKGVPEDSIAIIQEKVSQSAEKIENYWLQVANENNGTYLSALLKALNSNPGKYFDNLNFNDARLLYSPVFYKSLQNLLARNVNTMQPANKIIADIDSFLVKAQQNKEIYQYSLNYLIDFFHGYQKFGLNLVFKHLTYNYALQDSADWFDKKTKSLIKSTADKWTAASVGNMAPNLVMQSIDGDTINIKDIQEEYTLLLFWKTGCGHCTTAVKALKVFMDQTDDLNLKLIAIYTKTGKKDWENFLNEQNVRNLWTNVWDPKDENDFHSKYYVVSTPLLYVLDKNKKVVSIWNGENEIQQLISNLESQRAKLQKK